MKHCLHLLTLLMGLLASPIGMAWSVGSEVAQTRLIEVFTSQGCSSCPPADRWLSGIKQQPLLWRAVVPVAWHVTYWNYLGWRDPFSRRENDTRQRQQAATVGAQVYTPGVFLDRREWRGWRRQRLPFGEDQSRKAVGRLSAHTSGNRIHVELEPAPGTDFTPDVVELVFLRMNQLTPVKRGENRGHRLQHDFVAGPVARASLHREETRWVAVLDAVLDNQPTTDNQAVALWVLDRDGHYLQASGGWINGEQAHKDAGNTDGL